MDVAERATQGTGLGALDQPQGEELTCLFVDTFHVPPETSCKFTNADGAAVLLQRMHDRPAPFGQPSEKGSRRFEVQGLALVG